MAKQDSWTEGKLETEQGFGNHLSLQEAIFQPPKDSDKTFFIMTTRWRQIPGQGRKQAAYTLGFNLFLNPGGAVALPGFL